MTAGTALKAVRISKHFEGVVALDGAELEVGYGEVVGLVGDNGAGKSTLVKIIAGVHPADSGTVLVDGEAVQFRSPAAAQRAGVQVVYQDLALCGNLSAIANIYLHRESVRFPSLGRLSPLDRDAMRNDARKLVTGLGLLSSEDLTVPVARLSGGQQQTIAIARAMLTACRVLLLDEPTASLGIAERARVLEVIRTLRGHQMGIVIVSHNLAELLEVADRVVVLRLGKSCGNFPAHTTPAEEIVAAIVGVGSKDKGVAYT